MTQAQLKILREVCKALMAMTVDLDEVQMWKKYAEQIELQITLK